jgi:hypothetical protein
LISSSYTYKAIYVARIVSTKYYETKKCTKMMIGTNQPISVIL